MKEPARIKAFREIETILARIGYTHVEGGDTTEGIESNYAIPVPEENGISTIKIVYGFKEALPNAQSKKM